MPAEEHQPARGAEDVTCVLVVSPNRLDRDCTKVELSRAEGMIVEACDEPVSRVNGRVPDVIVLQDPHSVPDSSWLIPQLHSIAAHWPRAHVIVVGSQNAMSLDICLEARVRACLPREATPAQVIAAIRLIMSGLFLYPASQLERIGTFARSGGPGNPATAIDSRASRYGAKLTVRQMDVLRLLIMGMSNKEIARSLSISESTTKVHVRSILKQIGVSNRAQVVARFITSRSVF